MSHVRPHPFPLLAAVCRTCGLLHTLRGIYKVLAVSMLWRHCRIDPDLGNHEAMA